MKLQEYLYYIQEAINSRKCDYCGGQHRVELKVAHSAAISSTDCVGYSFSDDACTPNLT